MHQHDCVVIPNFGGLVANYIPGFADAQSKMLCPPKKGFVFNRFLQHNDGLLAHEIVKEENIAFQNAVEFIDTFVKSIQSEIQLKKRFDLGAIGTFFLDEKNNVSFHAKKESYLLSSFGLPVVKALPLPALEKETPIVQITTKETVATSDRKPLGKVVAIQEPLEKTNAPSIKVSQSKWWVAAALIPLGFYAAWIPLKTDLLSPQGNFQYSDLNPFSFTKAIQNYQFYASKTFTIDTLEKVEFSIFDIQSKPVETISTEVVKEDVVFEDDKVEKASTIKNTEQGYFVIGGCFKDQSNAEVFVKELQSKGFDALVVDYNKGLHRVAFGQYASSSEAKNAKSQITTSGEYSAWVLKK